MNNGASAPARVLVLAEIDEAAPHSHKVGVKTIRDEEWVHNGLRFYAIEDANAYAKDLLRRWPAIHSVAVLNSDDRPNASYPVPSDRYPIAGRGAS